MHTKYILWRVANGWLMTTDSSIWDNWDHRQNYAVFHDLKEFSDWVARQSKPKRKPQPRNHGKFASSKPQPTNRSSTNPRQPAIVSR